MASGKYKFVKNLNSTPRKNPSTNRKSKRRSNPTPNKKNNRRKKGNHMIATSFRLVRVGALVAPAAQRMMTKNSMEWKVKGMIKDYTGFSMFTDPPRWSLDNMKRGWMPYIGASIVTHAVPKLTSFIKSLF